MAHPGGTRVVDQSGASMTSAAASLPASGAAQGALTDHDAGTQRSGATQWTTGPVGSHDPPPQGPGPHVKWQSWLSFICAVTSSMQVHAVDGSQGKSVKHPAASASASVSEPSVADSGATSGATSTRASGFAASSAPSGPPSGDARSPHGDEEADDSRLAGMQCRGGTQWTTGPVGSHDPPLHGPGPQPKWQSWLSFLCAVTSSMHRHSWACPHGKSAKQVGPSVAEASGGVSGELVDEQPRSATSIAKGSRRGIDFIMA